MPKKIISWLGALIGLVVIIGGLVIGLSNQHVTYHQSDQAAIDAYIEQDTMHYLKLAGDTAIYMIDTTNFSPSINQQWWRDQGYLQASVIYDADKSTPVDIQGTTEHIAGQSYRVIALTFFKTPGVSTTFDTLEYKNHPQSYDESNLPVGIFILGLGILCLGGSVVLLNKSKRHSILMTQAMLSGELKE